MNIIHMITFSCLILHFNQKNVKASPESKSESSEKFSKLIQNVSVEDTLDTVNSRIYIELGKGILPIEKYKVFIQQYDIFVQNYFVGFFGNLAQLETDSKRKAKLEIYSKEADKYFKNFHVYYDQYEFQPTKFTEDWNKELMNLHDGGVLSGLISKDISTALANGFPHIVIWRDIIKVWHSFGKLDESNPYRYFIGNITKLFEGPLIQDFFNFVDGYYERLGSNNAGKLSMIKGYGMGIKAEKNFAIKAYETSFEEKFSKMAKRINEKAFKQVQYHPIYIDIAKGILPLETYKLLIQQDELYMRSFYQAYNILASREPDPKLKEQLTKNNISSVNFFNKNYKYFGFNSSNTPLPQTTKISEFVLNHAKSGPIAHGLASIFGLYTLWYEMGISSGVIANLQQNKFHLYRLFVENNDPWGNNHSGQILARMSETINGYYERLGHKVAAKLRMFEIYDKNIQHEFDFAQSIYQHKT